MLAPTFSYRSQRLNDSDSDSEDSEQEHEDWKRATRRNPTEDLEKIPMQNPFSNESAEPAPSDNKLKRKRNNIWSDVLQDQMISETLDHCGLKNKPIGYGSRGEESYDYTLGYNYKNLEKKESDSDNEMDDDVSEKEPNEKNNEFQSKKIVELNGAEKDAARKIIKVLKEPKKYLIFRIVKFIGTEKAMKLLKMTEDIEENGGMLINNQKRRRTAGGVFLQLLKSDKDIGQKIIDKVFEGELTSYDFKKKIEKNKKEKQEKKKKLKDNAKLIEEKQALLEKFTQELKRPTVESSEVQSSDVVEMEDESTVIDYSKSKIEQLNNSDLEDGELDD